MKKVLIFLLIIFNCSCEQGNEFEPDFKLDYLLELSFLNETVSEMQKSISSFPKIVFHYNGNENEINYIDYDKNIIIKYRITEEETIHAFQIRIPFKEQSTQRLIQMFNYKYERIDYYKWTLNGFIWNMYIDYDKKQTIIENY